MRRAEPLPAEFTTTAVTQSLSPVPTQPERLLERRWEPRYPTQDPATVKVLPNGKQPIPGRVLDISRFGVCLELPVELKKLVEVKVVILPGIMILGQVRYCLRRDCDFRVGISTREVIYDREEAEEHIHDDALALFANGRGLTAPEVIRLKDHLLHCELCRIRLAEAPVPRSA